MTVPVFYPHNAYYSITRVVAGPPNHYVWVQLRKRSVTGRKNAERKEGRIGKLFFSKMPNNSARFQQNFALI